MKVCAQQRPEYFRFVSEAVGEGFVHGPHTKCLASLSDEGELLGAVVYDRIDDRSCMLHVASDGSGRWFGREMLFWTFYVPFVQFGLRRLTGIVRADNEEALRFDRRLGFVDEGRLRAAFDGDVDGIVFGMLREECRFLDTKYLRSL